MPSGDLLKKSFYNVSIKSQLYDRTQVHLKSIVSIFSLSQAQTACTEEVCSVSTQLSQHHAGEDGRPLSAYAAHAYHVPLQAQTQDRRLPHLHMPSRYCLIFQCPSFLALPSRVLLYYYYFFFIILVFNLVVKVHVFFVKSFQDHFSFPL